MTNRNRERHLSKAARDGTVALEFGVSSMAIYPKRPVT
jgi:hypothetical protein